MEDKTPAVLGARAALLQIPSPKIPIASGEAYDSSTGEKGFDVSSLLPPNYYAAGQSVMNVTPIPEQLQKRIEDAFDTESPDEILKLFSKDHVQKLYSAFLGVSGSYQDASEIEPIWGRIQDIIRDHDSDRRARDSTPPEPKVTATGLSRTMLEHMTQLAIKRKGLVSCLAAPITVLLR
ncbi:MAG: hypothetical protein J3Q66DRAFT_403690 [Benniella sp.]|nr:MAG: hypothetical protein J3Q66DRAFT_403690 [Benniella sp.]